MMNKHLEFKDDNNPTTMPLSEQVLSFVNSVVCLMATTVEMETISHSSHELIKAKASHLFFIFTAGGLTKW